MNKSNVSENNRNGFFAVVVAGGTGKRFGADKPKQFCMLKHKPLLAWSTDVFLSLTECLRLVVVTHPDWIHDAEKIIGASSSSKNALIVPGGASRQDSSRQGLLSLDSHSQTPVLIHDAARPGVTPMLIRTVHHAVASGCDAVIPVVNSCDSLVVRHNNIVIDYPDRSTIAHVQTPQGFRLDVIKKAHMEAFYSGRHDYPDDGIVAQKAGYSVVTVPGDPQNRKVTVRGDCNGYNPPACFHT
jgi:2-C-methyl-D-erythritol 4-phosphate cytidylyltransferase